MDFQKNLKEGMNGVQWPMLAVSKESTVKCLEVSSDIFGYGRTSSLVFGNLLK